MSLTSHSIAELAQKKARRARANVQKAEAKLKAANHTLEEAIPNTRSEQIEVVHEDTKQAEQAVAAAEKELHVVEELLDISKSPGPLPAAPSEGLKSLLDSLRSSHPD